MNKFKEALKIAKKCKHCGGFLEPKFGDYHPICKQFAKSETNAGEKK